MTFWQTATQEQKLAQIDGGIDCGMNAPQIAMNCGTSTDTLKHYACFHGRNFLHVGTRGQGAIGKAHTAERAKVETFKRNCERYGGGPSDGAFSIFPDHSEAFELEWPA